MFTETEQKIIESFRGVNSKMAYKKLAEIYTKYTGVPVNGCGCKAQSRVPFLTMFYDWYEEVN